MQRCQGWSSASPPRASGDPPTAEFLRRPTTGSRNSGHSRRACYCCPLRRGAQLRASGPTFERTPRAPRRG
eukprot:16448318-Heterocapsa_arctica.AAC.2